MRTRARGHRTVFDGIVFRSRLEARWASLFKSLGWSYTYEPPVAARNYIPDFAIGIGAGAGFREERGILAECKPAISLNHRSFSEAASKIERSGLGGEDFLLLGARLFSDSLGRPILGLMREESIGVFLPCRVVRIGGIWLPTTSETLESDAPEVSDLWLSHEWSQSGNSIQWKGPKKALPKPRVG